MIVFAVPDLHFPFCDDDSIDVVIHQISKEKPDVVIQLGDLYDQYSFSRFDRDFNLMVPQAEIERGRAMAISFWKRVKKASPKARCIQLHGNHDQRLLKRALSALPEVYPMIKDANDRLYTFDGVETLKSDRDFVEIDGVIYCHGWQSKLGAHTNYFGKSVVRGHSHKAGLKCWQDESSKHKFLFEMECGCLVDETSLPLCYTASTYSKWTKALGVIVDGRPWLEVIK